MIPCLSIPAVITSAPPAVQHLAAWRGGNVCFSDSSAAEMRSDLRTRTTVTTLLLATMRLCCQGWARPYKSQQWCNPPLLLQTSRWIVGFIQTVNETNQHVQEQMKCLGVKWSVQTLLLYQSVICRIVLTTSEPLQDGAVCFLFNRFKIASVNAQKWTMKPGENDSGITAGRTWTGSKVTASESWRHLHTDEVVKHTEELSTEEEVLYFITADNHVYWCSKTLLETFFQAVKITFNTSPRNLQGRTFMHGM